VVIVRRRLKGILPYRAVYFPTESTVRETVANLGPIALARLFFTPLKVDHGRCLISEYVTTTVCLDLHKSLEGLWGATDATCRRQVRRAEKISGRFTIERNSVRASRDFLVMLNDLADLKEGVSIISSRMLALLEGSVDVFMLYLDGQPNCGHIFLRDAEAGRARLLHSANRRLQEPEKARLCADLNRFLHWHEVRLYRDDGFHLYDFGGINEDRTDGIARFKMSFGGDLLREYTYLCAGFPWLGRAVKGSLGILHLGRPTMESKDTSRPVSPCCSGGVESSPSANQPPVFGDSSFESPKQTATSQVLVRCLPLDAASLQRAHHLLRTLGVPKKSASLIEMVRAPQFSIS